MRPLRTSLLALLLALAACERAAPPDELPVRAVNPELEAHTAEFERRVYEVTEGVYQAVGFGLANSILVEGEECVFIVDTMASVESARTVRAEFEKITSKPIGALVYTHNHADHVFGARGFVPEGDVDVYAHETTEFYINRMVNIIRPIIALRSARMFGTHLPGTGPDRLVNAGIGAFLEIREGESTLSLIRPNRTFADELETEICGVQVQLVHAPGETNDQIFIWLPERKVLMPGDNVYKTFPNLYTIRGTLYRDVLEWVRSIDRMRRLGAEHLAPSHTRPVSGAEAVAEILTAYRDGIQFVHDQTIRGMNRGLTPDELVEFVKLPSHLARHPYLRELYGTVEWSVRSIFSGYLGWFDGDSATLSPAAPEERARGVLELAGGAEELLRAARGAVEAARFAWAAELAGYLLRVDPGHKEGRALKAAALRALGRGSLSPNSRNYYLTQALELEDDLTIDPGTKIDERVASVVASVPIHNFMAALPTRLDPQRAAEVELVVGFRFPDINEGYTIHVRRGVAEFQPVFPSSADVSITTDSTTWREIVLRMRNPAAAFASDDVQIEGSRLDLIRFLRLFDRS